MGRNKDLRKKIAGTGKAIEEHASKIHHERTKSHPNESVIGHWQAEIETLRKRVEHLNRRLKREW